ncbi:MAG: exopolysaccharide biosynthesis polyprenyl glycosylphosphotransferase [Gammaproteobacteria bacterium]|nr:exopolysaccharide biosynthesis polyprenyl glycosylphosphotransferase [Gammaproteobacteria bacterium]
MPNRFKRRHSRWYEVILFSSLFQFLLGFVIVVLLPNWLRWEELLFHWPLKSVQFNTLLANSVAYAASFFILHKFKRFPGTRSLPFIIPTILTAWLAVVAILLFLREESFARQVLTYSFVLANIWAFAGFFAGRRFSQPKLAVVPFGRALEVADTPHAIITVLDQPDLEGRRYDGIVADLHAEDLPDEWERFLANCTLARIPVFHTQLLLESITGRVKIDHLSENIFGSLLPSGLYSSFKRLVEVVLVLLAAPLWLPVMLITGIIIKLESDGSMFFIQERVGQGNKDFKVYKLRSMCKDSEKDGAQFAQANDMRITRVGKFIRKTRLDEIPQFINVLKGDMSLIGPRPEQRAFVDQFEREIPFYSYRHVVKPGITGWAQVVHGYAADADDTRVKIEHDFYYIKHFSLWLDILIVAKTIRTILTGFGAR